MAIPFVAVNHLTCYFCENVENNYICNRFAIDHPCPAGTTFCRTLHIMDTRGNSVVVNKHCATEDQCRDDRVGCLQQDHQKTCVSCCHSSYCNEPVPTNYSNAVRQPKPTAPTRAVKSAGAAAAPRLLLLSAAAASRLLLLLAAAAPRLLLLLAAAASRTAAAAGCGGVPAAAQREPAAVTAAQWAAALAGRELVAAPFGVTEPL
ncbi:Ly6/PLAUR domain-containing protein 6 [Amphibalanus amphitrite]|uniref:Ly6/PLAUR domain-containing protein 6 n=1 Tax=Amphibalanus amphitrite TaxID=1232801 RepID=A0A6A4W2P7_AMPAM|nr:Ly6/PLAUR domain-containing protein 6 [Amphibalanus amphitrite]